MMMLFYININKMQNNDVLSPGTRFIRCSSKLIEERLKKNIKKKWIEIV
jgi:hypothetical protein